MGGLSCLRADKLALLYLIALQKVLATAIRSAIVTQAITSKLFHHQGKFRRVGIVGAIYEFRDREANPILLISHSTPTSASPYHR
jgi:hypothetical protein